jgi:hypothetical protein
VSPDLDDTVVPPPRPFPATADTAFDDTVLLTSRGRAAADRPAGAPVFSAPVRATRVPGLRAAVLLPDGDRVEIVAPVLIGRRPTPPRIPAGPAPRLVTVASPRSEVSATHLALHLEGATLVATDLRAANGTVVRVPGSPARTLVGGESVVVTDGTVLDLGDGARLRVELERVALSGAAS